MPVGKRTKTKKSAPKKKKNVTFKSSQPDNNLKLMLAGVVLLLSAGLFLATQLALQQKKEIDYFVEINELLLEDSDKVKGYACGILSESEIENFLNVEQVKQNSINVSFPYGFSDPGQPSLQHTDGCYYESVNNSNEYAQVVVFTYPDSATSKARFEKHLSPVAKPLVKSGFVGSADNVLYDSGVHYILKGRQVIEIAASNGTPSESEQFSEKLVILVESQL